MTQISSPGCHRPRPSSSSSSDAIVRPFNLGAAFVHRTPSHSSQWLSTHRTPGLAHVRQQWLSCGCTSAPLRLFQLVGVHSDPLWIGTRPSCTSLVLVESYGFLRNREFPTASFEFKNEELHPVFLKSGSSESFNVLLKFPVGF